MTDVLLQTILNNLLISSVIAIVAWVVQKSGRVPFVAHLLWTVVLIKMITPPIWTIELIPIETLQAQSLDIGVPKELAVSDHHHFSHDFSSSAYARGDLITNESIENIQTPTDLAVGPPVQKPSNALTRQLFSFAGFIWIFGSIVIALAAFCRTVRFERQLRKYALLCDSGTMKLAHDVARKFGLRCLPRVTVCPANMSPFCWWTGGKPEIVLSNDSIQELGEEELQMVIAHEVAHLKRKDHWVRLLECMVTVLLWWNPVMWWARKQLRISEEMACDSLVLQKMKTTGHAYASSLLRMTELISSSAIRPPAMASAMTSGGKLEKRLKMIIKNPNPMASRRSYALVLLFAVCVFPLGLVYGQDLGAVKKRLAKSVEAGEITKAQAGFMLEALELSMKMNSHDKESRYEPRYREKGDLKKAEQREKYDQIVEEIKEAVERGKLSKRQAKEKIDAIGKDLFSKSKETEREEALKKMAYLEREAAARKYVEAVKRQKLEEELAARETEYVDIMRQIELAVKNGKLSKQDAKKKLDAIRKELFEKASKSNNDAKKRYEKAKSYERDSAERQEQYNQIYKKIEQAVKQGVISKESAQEKLKAAREDLYSERQKKNTENEYKERQRRDKERAEWEYRERDIREAQKQSYNSIFRAKQDAALEKEIIREHVLKSLNERYAAAARDIYAAAEKGKIPKQDAERKIAEIKHYILGNTGKRISNPEQRIQDAERLQNQYEKAVVEMERAIASGFMPKEKARDTAIELRKRIYDQQKREDERKEKSNAYKNQETRVRALERAAKELDQAIKSGKISRENALLKMDAMRRDIQIARELKDRRERTRTEEAERRSNIESFERQKKFMDAIKQLDEAVEKGKIEFEDAKVKANELRSYFYREREKKDPEISKPRVKKKSAEKKPVTENEVDENIVKLNRTTKNKTEKNEVEVLDLFNGKRN